MAACGADDLFLIGGDADPALGRYSSAVQLLDQISDHPRRPRTIGVAGYPEGHPFIGDAELEDALRAKARAADYVTTQMCFDPDAVRGWVERQRGAGMALPVLVGLPGKVARHRLLEMSMRIGVGPSLSFLRKQRGLRSLLSRASTADRLYDALAPQLEDRALDVAGFHIFTFNQLLDTWEWQQAKDNRISGAERRMMTAPSDIERRERSA
jgi:methylenetetrahydrofolate reductase (NADPH)